MGTKLTPEEIRERQRKRDAQFPSLTPEEIAEIDNANAAAEEISHGGHTNRRCLVCSGPLILEEVGSSYLVHCQREKRVILAARGI